MRVLENHVKFPLIHWDTHNFLVFCMKKEYQEKRVLGYQLTWLFTYC